MIPAIQIAEMTRGGEEFIAVFFVNMLLLFVICVGLGVAARMASRQRYDRIASGAGLVVAMLGGAAAAFSIQATPRSAWSKDGMLLGVIVLSTLVGLAVQWYWLRPEARLPE